MTRVAAEPESPLACAALVFGLNLEGLVYKNGIVHRLSPAPGNAADTQRKYKVRHGRQSTAPSQ